MKNKKTELNKYAEDILNSPNFIETENFIQHGNISVYTHSIDVAETSLKMGRWVPFDVNEEDLVRGALLHDYFLYDWHHSPEEPISIWRFYKKHGFTHPSTAAVNAERDFGLNERQEEIIRKHMWPLTIKPPMCREAWIVTMADKYCAIRETMKRRKKNK